MSMRTLLIESLLTLTLLTWLVVGAHASNNTTLGDNAGGNLTPSAHANTLLGQEAGYSITTGGENTLVGSEAGQRTTSVQNTFVGSSAGYSTTTGRNNVFFGWRAGVLNTTGSGNTYLGSAAGDNNETGYGNVFVGVTAGYNELGSHRLYIHNTSSSFPLIYGEFDNHLVGINGRLGVGTQIPLEKLHVRDGNLLISQTGATNARLRIYSNGNGWYITTNKDTGRLTFFSPYGGATTASFKFDRQATENLLRVGVLGPNIVDVNGNLMVSGTITPDYVFTPEYDLESIEAHAAYMWQHQHLPAVGEGQFNAQGQAMVNVGQRSQGMLEELEKAHIYIEQLKNESDQKGKQIAALTKEVTANEAQVDALEAEVTALKQKESQLKTLQGEVAALKEKEAQLEGLKGEMTALKALVNQLMVQERAAVPGKEG